MQEMQETQVPSVGWEDHLEKEMAAHSSILAWKITWTEKPGRGSEIPFNPWGRKESDMTEQMHLPEYLPECAWRIPSQKDICFIFSDSRVA